MGSRAEKEKEKESYVERGGHGSSFQSYGGQDLTNCSNESLSLKLCIHTYVFVCECECDFH